MAIEFNCKFCGKILRTGEDKAGRQAKCPSCGEAILVPASSEEDAADGGAPDGGAPDDGGALPPNSRSQQPKRKATKKTGSRSTSPRAKARDYVDEVEEYDDDDDEYDDYEDEPPRRSANKSKPCPVCGGPVTARDDDCPHCGEDLYASRQVSRSSGRSGGKRRASRSPSRSADTDYSAGEIIGDAWTLFTEEMGTFVGGTIISGLLGTFFYWGCYLFLILVGFSSAIALGRGGQIGPDAGAQLGAVMVVTVGVTLLVYMVGMAYLHLGLRLMFFNVVSGKGSDFGDLFRGGPYLGRFLIASFLFFLMYLVGSFLLVIPAIIVLLMFWPYEYALFDRDGGSVECLGDAKKATDGQWGTIFLLALASIGINMAGLILCGIGLLFSMPFTYAIFAVAYCRMAGVRVDV